jgi:hypothetical protein
MKPLFCIFALIASLWAHSAFAQPNVLGLPIVPQTPIDPPQAAQPAAGSASAPKGAKAVRPTGAASNAALPIAPPVNDADAKSVLNGGVTMATSYTHTLATLRITTNTLYKDETQRKQALTAGRLVQRDLYMACGKQCRPGSMPAPKLLPDGKLQFDLIVDGFNRVINNDDMMNMLLGRPLAVGAASPAIAAMAPGKAVPSAPAPAAAPAKPVAVATEPPLVRDPPALPALPDAVQVTRSIVQSSPSQAEPTK